MVVMALWRLRICHPTYRMSFYDPFNMSFYEFATPLIVDLEHVYFSLFALQRKIIFSMGKFQNGRTVTYRWTCLVQKSFVYLGNIRLSKCIWLFCRTFEGLPCQMLQCVLPSVLLANRTVMELLIWSLALVLGVSNWINIWSYQSTTYT